MEKDVKPFKQKGMTCAIACMLMVLEFYKIIPKANWLYEKKYFNSYKSRYMDGTPFSALAWHFSKNGLDTEIIHSEEELFNNSAQMLSVEIFEKSMKEYIDFLECAKEKGTKVSNGIDITTKLIKRKLDEDKLVILAGMVNNLLHAILICGYDDSEFIVCDPLYKQKQRKSYDEINEFMNTPLGKWCLVVRNKK